MKSKKPKKTSHHFPDDIESKPRKMAPKEEHRIKHKLRYYQDLNDES